MSEFYGRLQGNRGGTTRCGSKASGIRATVESWKIIVVSRFGQHFNTGEDIVSIDVTTKHGNQIASFGFNADRLYVHEADCRREIEAVEQAFKALDEATLAAQQDQEAADAEDARVEAAA